MRLELNRAMDKIKKRDFIENFIKELSKTLEKHNNKKYAENKENTQNIQLTEDEEREAYRKESKFLQDYFKKELSDLSKGEIYIVTNKYEKDYEYHRYKVAQYKNNFECKHIAFEKDLPENVQLGDVVRKINGKYIYDEQATKYVKETLDKIKQDIINDRE